MAIVTTLLVGYGKYISREIHNQSIDNHSIKNKLVSNGLILNAIHIETCQLLSKLDKMNQSKTKKPTLKITKTKKAITRAKAKTVKRAKKPT